MSFLSIVRGIGHGISVGVAAAQPLEPLIGSIPVVGAPVNAVLGAITGIEQLFPQSGMGAAKKTAVTALVSAAVPSVTAAPNLSTIIDELVAALNALSAAAAKLPAS